MQFWDVRTAGVHLIDKEQVSLAVRAMIEFPVDKFIDSWTTQVLRARELPVRDCGPALCLPGSWPDK